MPAAPPAPVTASPVGGAVHSAITLTTGTLILLILLGLFVVIVGGIIIYFAVRFIQGFLKRRSEFLYSIKQERMKLAGVHAEGKIHRWRTSKNKPLRLVYQNGEGVHITAPIAYYGGHYISSDGMIYIRFFSSAYKYIFFLPFQEPQLLIVPNRANIKIPFKKWNEKTREYEVQYRDVSLPKSIVSFNESEVQIKAEAIDELGSKDFFFPVLKDVDGEVIDLKYPVYHSFETISMSQVNLDNLEYYPKTIRQAVEMNPAVKIAQKTENFNNTIEAPPTQQQPQQPQRPQ